MPTGVYGFQKIAVGDDDEPHLNVISFLARDLGQRRRVLRVNVKEN
jgi:hypothetical protein